MSLVPLHIRNSNLLGTLIDEEVDQILAACRPQRFASGQVICRQGDPGESMYILLRGRVRIDVTDGANVRRLNTLGPGDHFGEMSLLVGGTRAASVTAVVETEVLELQRSRFERLVTKVPRFGANLSRSLGEWLQGQISGRHDFEPLQVALVRSSPAANVVATQVVTAIDQLGGEVHVLSDQMPLEPLATWQTFACDEMFQRTLLREQADIATRQGRVLVDVDRSRATPRLLMQNELVWWFVESEHHALAEAMTQIRQLVATAPQLISRIQLVQMVPSDGRLPPPADSPVQLIQPTLRIQVEQQPDGLRVVPRDVARLTRLMRGVQVGIALGGGGARGMAHLGILEVCEREGVYFDHIAGTSAGAIVAAAYAAGLPLERVRQVFSHELTPPHSLRWLPKSSRWYMLGVFRLGLAERKLRKYLCDYTFDQLLLPAQLVAVDLIRGEPRIRKQGDVVSAILQSINHPVFGQPILREGEALVDGGVLMNLPVTPLRDSRVDFVVAVDVSKQLSTTFGGNTPETPTSQMRQPGPISTLLRVTDVELKNLASFQGAQSDFLFAPDTGTFLFDDFSQCEKLVEVGRQAAEQGMPALKRALQERIGWHRPEGAKPSSQSRAA